MKKQILKFLTGVVVLITLISSLSLTVFAADSLSITGTGSGNVGGNFNTNATGTGYSVQTIAYYSGYRFTYMDYYGNWKGCVDIINGSEWSDYSNRKTSTNKWNKKELVDKYKSGASFSIGLTTTSNSTGVKDGGAYGLSYTVETASSDMTAWKNNSANVEKVLQAIDKNYTVDNMASSDQILVEPIIFCSIGGVKYALTLTEIWTVAGSQFGYSTCAKWGGAAGTYDNLGYRLNGTYPDNFYVDEKNVVCDVATSLNIPSSANAKAGPSFAKLITQGYGLHLIYKGDGIQSPSYTNTIGHWASGFKNSEGNNNAKTAYKIGTNTFTADVGNTYVLDKSDATTIPNGFELRSTFRTKSISGSWGAYNLGTKVTQKEAAMSYEYWYDPISYKINYVLNGGVNSANNPTSYNVLYGTGLEDATREGYAFKGWYAETDEKDVSLAAKTTTNYNYTTLFANVEPGVTYDVDIDSAKLTSGSATQFSVLIYDFTDSKTLASTAKSFGDNVSLSITCPETADASHNIKILIYAGKHGSTSGNAVTYSNVKIGYKATGINEGCKATFSSSDDLYNQLAARTTGNITLTALWDPVKANDIDIDYDGNGATTGENWTETVNLSDKENYTLSSKNDAFARVEEVEETGSKTLFKFMGWTLGDTFYDFGAEVPVDVLNKAATTVDGRDNKVVTVYATWDEYPVINAVDRWFTLDDAQNGKITLEELMKTASAVDGEVGDVTDFEVGEGSFTIIDYDVEESGKFTTTGSVTITYRAIDKVGNETYRTVTVHIVDKDQQVGDKVTQYTRFISKKYFKDTEGAFLAESQGGLNPYSVWINNSEYETLLTCVLNNTQNEETGEWDTVYQTFVFNIEEIAEVKEYIETHGLGNSLESDALAKFYDKYNRE